MNISKITGNSRFLLIHIFAWKPTYFLFEWLPYIYIYIHLLLLFLSRIKTNFAEYNYFQDTYLTTDGDLGKSSRKKKRDEKQIHLLSEYKCIIYLFVEIFNKRSKWYPFIYFNYYLKNNLIFILVIFLSSQIILFICL